jgi:hypothetical protein
MLQCATVQNSDSAVTEPGHLNTPWNIESTLVYASLLEVFTLYRLLTLDVKPNMDSRRRIDVDAVLLVTFSYQFPQDDSSRKCLLTFIARSPIPIP